MNKEAGHPQAEGGDPGSVVDGNDGAFDHLFEKASQSGRRLWIAAFIFLVS